MIIATVDLVDGKFVVWWTDVAPVDRRKEKVIAPGDRRVAGVVGSQIGWRNCGAWVLEGNDSVGLDSVTGQRWVALLPNATKSSELVQRFASKSIDLASTREAVVAERDRLQIAFDAEQDSRPKSRKLEAIRWIDDPGAYDSESLPRPEGRIEVATALAVSRWLVQLAEMWDCIERTRLQKKYLKELGPEECRALPVQIGSR